MKQLVKTYDEVLLTAQAMADSGYFKDARDASQTLVKILAGAEMGLGPFASNSGIHIIQGKPVLGANLMATCVANDPRYSYRVLECDNIHAAIEFYENGAAVGVATYDSSDAERAGLLNKDNWKRNPSDMYFARAMSRGVRRYCPGIFGGTVAYVPDELDHLEAEGDVIDYQEIDPSLQALSGRTLAFAEPPRPQNIRNTASASAPPKGRIHPPSSKALNHVAWSDEQLQVLIDEFEPIQDGKTAAAMLQYSVLQRDSHPETIRQWGYLYEAFRTEYPDRPKTEAFGYANKYIAIWATHYVSALDVGEIMDDAITIATNALAEAVAQEQSE